MTIYSYTSSITAEDAIVILQVVATRSRVVRFNSHNPYELALLILYIVWHKILTVENIDKSGLGKF